jgi:hypothetical protein
MDLSLLVMSDGLVAESKCSNESFIMVTLVV